MLPRAVCRGIGCTFRRVPGPVLGPKAASLPGGAVTTLCHVARHEAVGRATRWSGTVDDLARLASEGQQIVRSAGGADHDCSVNVNLRGRASTYDSIQEFVAALSPSDIPRIRYICISYNAPWEVSKLSASIHLYVQPARRVPGPYVAVKGEDISVVEGVRNRLLEMLGGTRLRWPGARVRRSWYFADLSPTLLGGETCVSGSDRRCDGCCNDNCDQLADDAGPTRQPPEYVCTSLSIPVVQGARRRLKEYPAPTDTTMPSEI